MIDLEKLHKRKLPLSYGTDKCRLVLNDSRYSEELVALRNDATLNRYIHHDPLTVEKHDAWLSGQLDQRDALNFAILVDGEFAGSAAIYNITTDTAEYGRFVMKPGRVRAAAPLATLLIVSFALEIMGLPEVNCKILEGNTRVLRFHERMGWKRNTGHDVELEFDGEQTRQHGYSISAEEWPAVFEAHRDLMEQRLAC